MATPPQPTPPTPRSRRKGIIRPGNARYAGLFCIVGVAAFLIGMSVAEIGYGSSYSVSQNLLSDLGVTSCGAIDSTGRSACSPWFLAFDASTFIIGLLTVYAAVWARRAFPDGVLSSAGLGLLALNGMGLIGAGLTPENLSDPVHTAFALLAFACGAVSLLILGVGMGTLEHWRGFRAYSVASGLVSGIALLLFASGTYLGLGIGGMERLIVAPILVWLFVIGIHLIRTPSASLERVSTAGRSRSTGPGV
jgi:hypothetical membrane protein